MIRPDDSPSQSPCGPGERSTLHLPAKRLKSNKFGIRPRPSKSPHVQAPITPSSPVDVKPVMVEQPSSDLPEVTEFKAALLEYGQAIIKSAMDYDSDDVSSLERDMTTTKAVVVEKHEKVAKELDQCRTDLIWEKDQNGKLHQKLVRQESEASEVSSDLATEKERTNRLERELETALREKDEHKALSQKTLLDLCQSRRECEKLEKENSRKRYRPEEIWERVEKVKMAKVGSDLESGSPTEGCMDE
jgi:hypothetical protein